MRICSSPGVHCLCKDILLGSYNIRAILLHILSPMTIARMYADIILHNDAHRDDDDVFAHYDKNKAYYSC